MNVGAPQMKMKITRTRILLVLTIIVLACFISSNQSWSKSQVPVEPIAVVKAMQGSVDMTMAEAHQPVELKNGDIVHIRDTIATNAHSKLLLKWKSGVLTSLGEQSSVLVSQREAQGGPVNVLNMTKGVLRVSKPRGCGKVTPYRVTTPEASIEPLNFDEPVDFIVDVRSPTMSVITVISGPVRINNLSVAQPMVLAVSACHTVFVNQGIQQPKVFGSDSGTLGKLVNRTTIPGTLAMNFACPVPTWLF